MFFPDLEALPVSVEGERARDAIVTGDIPLMYHPFHPVFCSSVTPPRSLRVMEGTSPLLHAQTRYPGYSLLLLLDQSSLSSPPPNSYRKTRLAFRSLCSTWFCGTSIFLACCLPQVDPTGYGRTRAAEDGKSLHISSRNCSSPPSLLLLLLLLPLYTSAPFCAPPSRFPKTKQCSLIERRHTTASPPTHSCTTKAKRPANPRCLDERRSNLMSRYSHPSLQVSQH